MLEKRLRPQDDFKRFLRLYRFMNDVSGRPKGFHILNKEERILLPEEWVQRFVNDPEMNSIGERILLQHSSCIMYYWLFCAVTIYVRCMVRTTTALFLYCSTAQ